VLSAHRRRTADCGRLIAIAALLLIVGCTAQTNDTSIFGQLMGPPPDAPPSTPPPRQASTLGPDADKSGCGSAAECKLVLKTMIESADRSWIGERPPPDVYANGTRLFAYRALRKQLTCAELGHAVDELSEVAKTLGATVPGMSPDQASRTRVLSSQVQGVLAKERRGRCKT
jgi:hypothetical protein